MAVFPKEMDRMGEDTQRNIAILDAYVRYMAERVEFSMAGLGRTVSGAGMTSAELAVELKGLKNSVGAQTSAVSLLTGEVNGVKADLAALSGAVSGLNTAVSGLNTAVSGLQDQFTALDGRVAALEEDAGGGTAPSGGS